MERSVAGRTGGSHRARDQVPQVTKGEEGKEMNERKFQYYYKTGECCAGTSKDADCFAGTTKEQGRAKTNVTTTQYR
jgi:hypothetical protein